MGSWKNNDGLYLEFGTTKATPEIGGEYKTYGLLREIELTLDLTDLTETETIVADNVFIPAGVRIVDVETIATTAAATGTAIDVGLIKSSDRSTEIDYNGLLAAAPTANMGTNGERSVYQKDVTVPTGLTGTGALVGTTTAYVGHVSASRTDSTAFTAGTIILKIRYYTP